MAPAPFVIVLNVPDELYESLARQLGDTGCDVVRAHAPGELVFRAISRRPTVVLVDGSAPTDSTRALVEALESDPETADVPVIGADFRSTADALAAVTRATMARASRPSMPEQQRKPSVLLVDDDRDLRFLLGYELQGAGFDVIEAEDGLDALEKLESASPDVVLLDLMMPRLDGVGFLVRLNERVTAAPPVVIYSAYARPGSLEYPNVQAVLHKPSDVSGVVAALKRSIRGCHQPHVDTNP